MKKPVRQVVDYILLTILVSAGILLTLYFNGSPIYQKYTIIALSLIYIVWGLYHHARERTLHANIVLEYVFFALLGTALVIGLL